MSKRQIASKHGEEYLFELAGYLITCATMALSGDREGSPKYSANRFLIALRKLIALPKYVESLNEDSFLEDIVGRLDDIKLEYEELHKFLMEFAVEASNRLC